MTIRTFSLSAIFLVAVSFVAVLFFIPNITQAEEVPFIPEIFVTDVSVQDQIVTPGQTLSGSATLVNQGSMSATNVRYVVRFVGEYDEFNVPGAEYASVDFGPVFVGAGERKEVPFSITLPSAIPVEGAGVEVQAFLETGAPLGWGDTKVLVQGAAPTFRLLDAYVTLTGDGAGTATYDPQEGPTVHEGMGISLNVIFTNDAPLTIAVKPTVAVHRINNTSPDAIEVMEQGLITVAPQDEVERSFSLPTFSMTPGVYIGTLVFEDEVGNALSGTIDFRYIVGGDFATIQSVTADKEALIEGELINVAVAFSGVPQDVNRTSDENPFGEFDELFANPPEDPEEFGAQIDVLLETLGEETFPQGNLGQGTVSVVLFNERNQRVAEQSETVNLDADTRANLLLEAERAAQGIRAEVTIARGEEVLAFMNVPISANYTELQQTASGIPDMTIILVAIGVVLIVVGGVIFVMRRKQKPEEGSPTPPPLASLILAFGFAASGAILAGTPLAINAYTVTNGCWHGCMGAQPHIFLNTPALAYEPGETFYIQGTVRSYMCYNKPNQFVIVYGRNDGGAWKTVHRNGWRSPSSSGNIRLARVFGRNGKLGGTDDRFTVGPFTAPDTPGTYRVDVWTYYYWIGNHGIVEHRGIQGFQEYFVQGEGTVDLVASEPEVFSGELFAQGTDTRSSQTAFAFGGFNFWSWPGLGGTQQNSGVVFSGLVTNTSSDRAVVDSFNSHFQIDLDNDGTWDTTLAADAVSALGPTASQPVRSSSWTPVIGTHSARLCADTGFTIDESDENNNCSRSNLLFTVTPRPQCSDGIDNDGNGTADFYGVYSFTPTFSYLQPDPGCSSPQDPLEEAPQCSDGIDNDNNGLTDYPDDPSCSASSDDLEQEPTIDAAELMLDASPRLIRSGESVTLTWNANGVEDSSCGITGTNGDGWSSLAASGSQTSGAITTETTFTLSCTALKDSAPVTAATTVKLVPRFEEQ